MLSASNPEVKKPKACILLLTLGCSLRCKMCYLWRNDERNVIKPNQKEWKEFIVSLSDFSNQGLNVIFGGGEPLLFPDTLTELIAHCHAYGIRTSLATSGYFIDEKMAERLVSSGLDYLALTLYSFKKETHNFLRGVSDSYERLQRAIGYLASLQSALEIAIDTVIMAPNVKELLDLTHWVRQDKRLHAIFFQAVVQPFHSQPIEEWYKTEEYNFLWPKDLNEVDILIDTLIKLKENSVGKERDKINNPVSQLKLFKSYFKAPQDFVKRFSCNITNGEAFTVSPEGSINLCPYMKSVGNIRSGDIKEIWHSQEAGARRKELALCNKNCHHIINCWYEEERAC